MNAPPRTDVRPPPFEEVAHTADRSLRIRGGDWAELFANAAAGMNSLMGPHAPDPTLTREIALEAIDLESLLVAWLSELAFWAETEALVFTRFEFRRLTREALTALAHGCRADRIDRHVKAVTFHGLSIAPEAGGWVTTVVFDV
jgi:SHS2 domain-containing protein